MLFDMTGNRWVPVQTCSFVDKGETEAVLRQRIAATPNVLDEELLIIQEEWSGFEGAYARPDLIGLDRDGRIVLIELKRSDATRQAICQVMTYMGYASRLDTQQILEMFGDYLERTGRSRDEALSEVCRFVGEPDPSELRLNPQRSQRGFVVAESYSTDAVVGAKYLSMYGMSVQLFETTFLTVGEHRLVDLHEVFASCASNVNPVLITSKECRQELVCGSIEDKPGTYQRFWPVVQERFDVAGIEPFAYGVAPTGGMLIRSWHGREGVSFALVMNKSEAAVVMYFRRGNGVLEAMFERRASIERRYGERLHWRPETGRFGVFKECSIHDERNWGAIADWMLDTFQRFIEAVEPDLNAVLSRS